MTFGGVVLTAVGDPEGLTGFPLPIWVPYAVAVVIIPAGLFVGAVISITAGGWAANACYWGGIVGFFMTIFYGLWYRLPAFILIAAAGYLLGQVQSAARARHWSRAY